MRKSFLPYQYLDVLTMKGAYGDPENTGVGYNTIITELGDHSVPKNWEQFVAKRGSGETPGPPIIWSDPQDPEDAQPGYGFIADDTNEEETFFYHSDHLGSTSYITDDKGNITQYTAYLPYGELLVDEHSSSEEMPYKFNGKELDEETGLYYYGARYMQPVASIWYGVDAEFERSVSRGSYVFCNANPVRLVDPDGRWSWPWERKSLIRYTGDGVFKLNIKNFSANTRNTFNRMNNDPHYWKAGEIGIDTEVGKIQVEPYASYTSTHKPIGIEEKQMTLEIKVRNAQSTGLPDKRFKHRSISPVKGAKGAGAMLAFDFAITALDQYTMLSNVWDMDALEKQTKSLADSFHAVDQNRSLIPDNYKNNANVIGAIINYVFQGENSTKNKDVETIGKKILLKLGRYDNKSKNYIPFINEKK